MKILFLDIDGVLNSAKFIQFSDWTKADRESINEKIFGKPDGDFGYYAADIDVEALRRLRLVCSCHPDLKIVISSSWRQLMQYWEISKIFSYLGWKNPPIIGQTPNLDRRHISPEGNEPVLRGHEIQYWLDHACVDMVKDKRIIEPATFKYVILDDDSDFLEGQPLVKTSWETGLLPEHLPLIDKVLQ